MELTGSTRPSHSSCWNHRTTPAVADRDSPCHDCSAVDIPCLDFYRSKRLGTGFHSRTRGSTPGWGPAHIVHSHIGYLDHTVGSTPGDRAQMCNPADAHTFLTHNFAPAHNVPPGDNTAVDADSDADVDHTVLPDCNQNDIQVLLGKTASSGMLHGVSYRSQAHSQSQPFFSDCFLAVSISVQFVAGDFSLESLAVEHLALLRWHSDEETAPDWSMEPVMNILFYHQKFIRRISHVTSIHFNSKVGFSFARAFSTFSWVHAKKKEGECMFQKMRQNTSCTIKLF